MELVQGKKINKCIKKNLQSHTDRALNNNNKNPHSARSEVFAAQHDTTCDSSQLKD